MLDRTRRTSIGAHPSHRRQTMAATIPAPVETRAAAPKLRRTIGLWMATALVVGNMIGSGVFMLPATLAGAAGPISLLGWIFTGAGAMLLALVFANLGRALPRTGGPYAYARRAFGDFIGFQTAWGYWIAVWAGNAGDRRRVRQLPHRVLAAGRRQQAARRTRRDRPDLA